MPFDRTNEHEGFWGVWVTDPEAVETGEDYSQYDTNACYWVVKVENGRAVKYGTVDPLFETLGKARAAAYNNNLLSNKYEEKEARTYEIRKETKVGGYCVVQKRGTGYGAGAWCAPTLSMEVVDTIVIRN
jgi:hypothetical protein